MSHHTATVDGVAHILGSRGAVGDIVVLGASDDAAAHIVGGEDTGSAGVLNLVAVIALVVAGILVFISRPVFWAANEMGDSTDHWGLGTGWVFAGILAIVGGVLAILPAAVDFIGSKKK